MAGISDDKHTLEHDIVPLYGSNLEMNLNLEMAEMREQMVARMEADR
jgi:hypothetical protein